MAEEVKNKNGVEFDIDAMVTDLNGKADKDLANINISSTVFARKLQEAGINFVVSISISSDRKSWCRIWSDGWCEQGGTANVTNGTKGFPVTLIENYVNTDYQVVIAPHNSAYATSGWGVDALNTSTFKIYCNNNSERIVFWQACGYIR